MIGPKKRTENSPVCKFGPNQGNSIAKHKVLGEICQLSKLTNICQELQLLFSCFLRHSSQKSPWG